MQFSDVTNNTGILQDITFLTGADTNAYPNVERTRNANRWYYKAVIAAFHASADWDFDDTNQAGTPINTSSLTNSTATYTLPSGALKIKRVEVLDSNSDWKVVQPINDDQIKVGKDEFMSTDGLPLYYELEYGNTLRLYPAPDNNVSVTLTNGLRVYHLREVDEFVASDTTQEPGLAEPYHRILSLGAAYDFAIAKGKDNASVLRQELEMLMNDLKEYYAKRHDNFDTRIRPRIENYV